MESRQQELHTTPIRNYFRRAYSNMPGHYEKKPRVTEDPIAPKQQVKTAKQAAGVGVPKILKPPIKKADPNCEGEDGIFQKVIFRVRKSKEIQLRVKSVTLLQGRGEAKS